MLNLDNDRDFPFYNEIPKMPKVGWLVLLICIPISYMAEGMIADVSNELVGSIFFLLIMLIPLLYFIDWDYSLIFQKPTRNELILAVLMFLTYTFYSLIFSSYFDAIGIPAVANNGTSVITIISLIFSIMAEELMKFIPLMFLLRVFFKYTSDRRLSLIISCIITLTYFGLMHSIGGSQSILSALVIQGAGSLFHLYVYLKSKNLFASYLSHLMTDGIILTLSLLGTLAV